MYNNNEQSITTKIDVNDLIRYLNEFEKKQFPFAASKAINDTAFMVRTAVMQALRSQLDRPVPYTVNSLFIKKSTKLNLSAELFWKMWPSRKISAERYMEPNIKGGLRNPKGSELLLRKAGIIGQDQFLVPASGANIDTYGNIKYAQMIKAIEELKGSLNDQGNSGKMRKYFVAGPSTGRKRKDGSRQNHSGKVIMIRSGVRVFKPFMFITAAPRYHKTFHYYDIADQEFRRLYKGNFSAALEFALKTAKNNKVKFQINSKTNPNQKLITKSPQN